MPYKDKEKRKEYQKNYRQKNREKLNQQKKQWKEDNKDKHKENHKNYMKEWREKNKDRYVEKNRIYAKNYYRTDKGKKLDVIRCWKRQGIIDGDFDSLYEDYKKTTECMICGQDFSKHKKCLDHDHKTGEIRYICCNWCNSKLLCLKYKNI